MTMPAGAINICAKGANVLRNSKCEDLFGLSYLELCTLVAVWLAWRVNFEIPVLRSEVDDLVQDFEGFGYSGVCRKLMSKGFLRQINGYPRTSYIPTLRGIQFIVTNFKEFRLLG